MINQKELRKILKTETISGLDAYNFNLNRYKDNYNQLLKLVYLRLRVMNYNASDFISLKNKCLKFENWSAFSISKQDFNEFRNLIFRIVI